MAGETKKDPLLTGDETIATVAVGAGIVGHVNDGVDLGDGVALTAILLLLTRKVVQGLRALGVFEAEQKMSAEEAASAMRKFSARDNPQGRVAEQAAKQAAEQAKNKNK